MERISSTRASCEAAGIGALRREARSFIAAQKARSGLCDVSSMDGLGLGPLRYEFIGNRRLFEETLDVFARKSLKPGRD